MFSFFKSASSVLDAMDCFRESLRFGALSSLSSSSVDFESKGTTDVDMFIQWRSICLLLLIGEIWRSASIYTTTMYFSYF